MYRYSIVNTARHGMKKESPTKYVKFYSKRNPTSKSRSDPVSCSHLPWTHIVCRKEDYCTLLPDCFAEDQLRIYTNKREYSGRVQGGYLALVNSSNGTQPADKSIITPAGPATPAIEVFSPFRSQAPNLGRLRLRRKYWQHRFQITSSNKFMTISPTPTPKSPTRDGRKRLRIKDESKYAENAQLLSNISYSNGQVSILPPVIQLPL